MSKSVTDPVAQEPGTAKRPFGMRDKIGYMFGDFGNDFTFILQMMFFMLFYTNVVGIQPGHVGLLFLVARVVDGFTDVGLGIIVDRLPVKKQGEKFKRWIKYIAIPVAVASALMYMSFVADWESYTARVAWMTATYFLWGSVCYTAINIPYGSMASVISADPDDRAQLSVFRSTGANLAMLIISSLLPLIVYTRNAEGVAILDGQRMTIAAVVCSVLAVVCYAFCYFNVEERVIAPAKPRGEGGAGIGKMLASITTNRALLTLILAALLLLLGNLFLSGMLGYVFLTYFGNGQLQAGASLAALLPTFALIVVAPFLGKRYGKAETGAVAMIIAGVVFIGAYFLQTENAVLWIVLYAIAASASRCSTSWSGRSSPTSSTTRTSAPASGRRHRLRAVLVVPQGRPGAGRRPDRRRPRLDRLQRRGGQGRPAAAAGGRRRHLPARQRHPGCLLHPGGPDSAVPLPAEEERCCAERRDPGRPPHRQHGRERSPAEQVTRPAH